jgi:hypothetical protein
MAYTVDKLHWNKLENNDLTRQTELRKRIAGIKAELGMVG